jgi:hypothetical protein
LSEQRRGKSTAKIGSTRQVILAGVSLKIIRKPSIKPSLESDSIYVLADATPVKVPPSNPGAAAPGAAGSVQARAAGQPSEAGSIKNPGAGVSEQTKEAGQASKSGTSIDPGAADPLVERVFHVREIPSWAEPFSYYLIFGDLPASEEEAR